MKDTICREDAIELCAEAQGRATTKAELKGISKVWQGLLKLPSAEAAQGWIPCSERLPSDNECVIVSVLDDHGDTSWKYTVVAWLLSHGCHSQHHTKAMVNDMCKANMEGDIV